MTLKRFRSRILTISFIVLAAGMGYWAGQREIDLKWENNRAQVTVVNKAVPANHQDVDFSIFWEVWDRLENQYLDSALLDKEKMVYGAVAGMTSALGDPYTVFLPPKQQQESKEELSGAFEGVGIQLGYKDDRLAVIAPLDDMPAKAAGIEAGDLIIHIKDEKKNVDVSTDGMSLPEAVEIIRGPKGEPVILTLARVGQDPFNVSIKRDTIIVKSTTIKMIKLSEFTRQDGDESKPMFDSYDPDSKVAYIRLSRFGERTSSEWDDVVRELIKNTNSNDSNVRGIVLDVRNNPGGYLDAAVVVASEFFADGTVVEQKGKTDSQSFIVKHPGRLTEIPLVVLINQGSASASEIVSGAIQARDRGLLVGQNSFGKGTVQDAQELRLGAGLHITTARWLLPNGGWIHDAGLKPDVEVEYDQEASKGQSYDNQFVKAVETLLKS